MASISESSEHALLPQVNCFRAMVTEIVLVTFTNQSLKKRRLSHVSVSKSLVKYIRHYIGLYYLQG